MILNIKSYFKKLQESIPKKDIRLCLKVATGVNIGWQHLPYTTFLDKNKFFSLAIDQGTSLKNLIKENKKDFREIDYFYFKKQVILNLSSEVSSILFDYDTFQSDEIYHKLNVPKIIAYEDALQKVENNFTSKTLNYIVKNILKTKRFFS